MAQADCTSWISSVSLILNVKSPYETLRWCTHFKLYVWHPHPPSFNVGGLKSLNTKRVSSTLNWGIGGLQFTNTTLICANYIFLDCPSHFFHYARLAHRLTFCPIVLKLNMIWNSNLQDMYYINLAIISCNCKEN